MKKSDTITFRIPSELKEKAKAAAEKEKRTLSTWIEIAIEEKLSKLKPKK